MSEFSHSKPKKYWAFISYSHKDNKWANWLIRRLESYPIPKEFQGIKFSDGGVLGKHLRPVFRDRDELPSGAELGPAIEGVLQDSRYLIVLCSQNAAQSQWVNKEIEFYRATGRAKFILTLILDGTPNATSSPQFADTEECFPCHPSSLWPTQSERIDVSG